MLPFYKPGLRSLRNGATTPLPRGFPPNARSRRLQDPKLQRRACQVQRLPAQVVFDYYFCGSEWVVGSLLISQNNDYSGEELKMIMIELLSYQGGFKPKSSVLQQGSWGASSLPCGISLLGHQGGFEKDQV